MPADLSILSTPEILHLLGRRYHAYRIRLRLTQQDVADQSGISLPIINQFENGKSNNMSMSSFLRLIHVIGLTDNLDQLLPELPDSPYEKRIIDHTPKRIRKK